ncbi:MAG: pyruvate, water dikinase regulatory protein [Pseudomonadota bacterium]|nr:pyruvate, water dikinase regulatory protein [Pseudomonadota bacterium]
MKKKVLNILLLSDSTGETVTSFASMLKAQYPHDNIAFEMIPFFKSLETSKNIFMPKIRTSDLIIHTLVDKKAVGFVKKTANQMGKEVIELLTKPLKLVGEIVGTEPLRIPVQHYQVNQNYFKRINAIDFAMYTDDGRTGERLLSADVIILGVSRTSKTPTCIYLAYQGIRAANLPLVQKQEPPQPFYEALSRRIPMIGLVASISRLRDIRSNRLQTLGTPHISDYTDSKKIQEELVYSRMFFARYKIPLLDVTRRSIEETAASIRQLINK